MIDRFDIAVIGGGVLGCAVALEAARRGHAVVVIERGDIANAISGGSLAAVTRHLTSEPEDLPFVMDSCDRWYSLADEFRRDTGIDIELDRVGQLRIVEVGDGMEAALGDIARGVEEERALGLDVRTVTPLEVVAIAPALSRSVVAGGSFCPVDGKLNPLLTVRALAAAAARRGVAFRTGTAVLDIEPGDPVRLRTNRGTIEAQHAVVAAGPWSQMLLAPLDVRLAEALVPKRAQCCATQALAPMLEPVLASVSVGIAEGYTQLHQTRAGQILFNTVVRSDDPRRDGDLVNFVDDHFLVESARTLTRLFPQLATAFLQRSWDACESWTADHRLAIGPVAGADGVFVCSGDSGTGFLRAPGAARAVVALIEGAETEFDLSGYAPERPQLDDGRALAEVLHG